MKITGYSDSLRITLNSGRDIGSLLKGVAVGDRVEAKIISRDGNVALLDIAGKRIRADFTAGIPAGSAVELILSEKSRSSAVFRLPTPGNASELPLLLKQYFMAGDKIPDRGMFAELWRLISGGRADLSEINLFLAGIKKDHLKEKNYSELINRLNFLKVPVQTLTDISLIAAMKLPAALFQAVLFFMEKAGKKHGFAAGDERIDDILHDIENLDDELFSDLLKLLAAPDTDDKGYGKFPVNDEGDFSGFEYIYTEDSFFLTFSLSQLGRISMLIRSEKGHTSISIGAENDRAVEMLEADSQELKKSLEQNGVSTGSVGFFNTKKVVDKLHVLCGDFQLKSGLDVKI